ncbi:unnamed protein product [Gordionus sp. m RMFG-2023]|uniref:uncharacterized protein LOC135923242 n=1 Tax=Gordionus sp. m RMFG-2023 TaxID=3053472 RepID=UPI0030E5CB0E
MATIGSSYHHDIVIPVEKNIHENPGERSESSEKFKEEMRKMEEEMERVKKDLLANTSSASGSSPDNKTLQQSHSTKLHSYQKTTKTESKKVTKEGGGGTPYTIQTTSTSHQPSHTINIESSNISDDIPRSSKTIVKEIYPERSGNEEIYRANISPGATITIKATSREGTPIRKVVIVQENDKINDSGVSTSFQPTYHSSPNPKEHTIRVDRHIDQHEVPLGKREESKSEKKEFTTSTNVTGNENSTRQETIKREEKRISSSFSSTSNLSNPSSESSNITQDKKNLDSSSFDMDKLKIDDKDAKVIETDHSTGIRHLKLRYEISSRDYEPQDINVRVTKDKVFIKAEHKETTAGKSVWRECSKEFSLPDGANIDSIRSSFNPDLGILTIDVPLFK